MLKSLLFFPYRFLRSFIFLYFSVFLFFRLDNFFWLIFKFTDTACAISNLWIILSVIIVISRICIFFLFISFISLWDILIVDSLPCFTFNSLNICCLVAESCPTLLWSQGPQPARRLVSMEFSRQVYWSGLPFPSPGGLPDLGIKPASSALLGRFFTFKPPGKPMSFNSFNIFIKYVLTTL